MQSQRTETWLRESDEIQGNILAGFKQNFQDFVLLRFSGPDEARAWCRTLFKMGIATTRKVADANAEFKALKRGKDGVDPPEFRKRLWLNIAFTFAGLNLLAPELGLMTDEAMHQRFPAFCQGPVPRARLLGDTERSHPENWIFGKDQDRAPVHAIVTIAADEEVGLMKVWDALKQRFPADWEKVAFYTAPGRARTDALHGHEHFGFKDGISQPLVKGFNAADDAQAARAPLIEADQFVLGSVPESQSTAGMPSWMHNGSFQVFRRLVQDVPGWRRRIKTWNSALESQDRPSTKLLEAKLIGRWPSGEPLALAPQDGDLPLPKHMNTNAFVYVDDPDGRKTPRYAHIRRMYPRDDTRFRDSKRRIIRRGIPFGNPLSEEVEEEKDTPEGQRGLLFNAFMASIEGQFEYLQRSWGNNPYFPGSVLGHRGGGEKEGIDPVIGLDTYADGNGSLESYATEVSAGQPPSFQRFVRTTGTIYAFAPSLATLEKLAKGDLTEDDTSAMLADVNGQQASTSYATVLSEVDVDRRQAKADANTRRWQKDVMDGAQEGL